MKFMIKHNLPLVRGGSLWQYRSVPPLRCNYGHPTVPPNVNPITATDLNGVFVVLLSYIANPCRRLRRPLNGVLMCSSTSSGGGTQLAHDTLCRLFCHRGFVPARSVDVNVQTAESFHCDRTGTWQPTEHVPSCVSK